MNDKTALPLSAGDEDGPNAAFRRQIGFYPFDMGFLPGECHARPGINTPLQHLVAVILEPFAKIMGGFPLWLRANGQIECDDQPAHFKFFGVHGL